jgi:hypothetical protein
MRVFAPLYGSNSPPAWAPESGDYAPTTQAPEQPTPGGPVAQSLPVVELTSGNIGYSSSGDIALGEVYTPPAQVWESNAEPEPLTPPDPAVERNSKIADFYNREDERKSTVAEYKAEQIKDSQHSDKERQIAEDVIMTGLEVVLTAGIGPELILTKIPKLMRGAQAVKKAKEVLDSKAIHNYLVRRLGARMVENGEIEHLVPNAVNPSGATKNVIKQFVNDLAQKAQRAVRPADLLDQDIAGQAWIKKAKVQKVLDEVIDSIMPSKPASNNLAKLANSIRSGKSKAKSIAKQIADEIASKTDDVSKRIKTADDVVDKAKDVGKTVRRVNRIQNAGILGTAGLVAGGTAYPIIRKSMEQDNVSKAARYVADNADEAIKYIDLTGFNPPGLKNPEETVKTIGHIGGLDMPTMQTWESYVPNIIPFTGNGKQTANKPTPDVEVDVPDIPSARMPGGGGSGRPGTPPAAASHCVLLYERVLNGEEVDVPPECEEYFNWANLHYNKKSRSRSYDRSARQGRPHRVRRPGDRSGSSTPGDAFA